MRDYVHFTVIIAWENSEILQVIMKLWTLASIWHALVTPNP